MARLPARPSASRSALPLLVIFGAHVLSPLVGLATPSPARAEIAIAEQDAPSNSLWVSLNTETRDLVRAPERQNPGRLPQRCRSKFTRDGTTQAAHLRSRSPAHGPLRCVQLRIHFRDRGSRDPDLPA